MYTISDQHLIHFLPDAYYTQFQEWRRKRDGAQGESGDTP